MLEEVQHYVQETLGAALESRPWPGASHVPHYLKERYHFAQAEVLGIPVLLAVDNSPQDQSPAVIRKHMDALGSRQPGEVIYIRPHVTAYNRKRLIQQRVPFIVPGNQMYLPMLAIDLREHFRRSREVGTSLSPSAQLLLLYALETDVGPILNPTEMSARLGYSVMTLTRAFDELEAHGLAQVSTAGRSRFLELRRSRRDTWEDALALFRSPVQKRLFVDEVALEGVQSGLTALSRYSDLVPPEHLTIAVSREAWSANPRRKLLQMAFFEDPGAREVEIWRYSPDLLARDGFVDVLSLYLTLRADPDERTQAALDGLIERFPW